MVRRHPTIAADLIARGAVPRGARPNWSATRTSASTDSATRTARTPPTSRSARASSAVADAYDAMTRPRVFRDAIAPARGRCSSSSAAPARSSTRVVVDVFTANRADPIRRIRSKSGQSRDRMICDSRFPDSPALSGLRRHYNHHSSCPTFEPVIGLEIHAQLLTATKIFCGCSTRFGADAQYARCARSVSGCRARCRCSIAAPSSWRSRAALALGCTVHPSDRSSRARTTSIPTCPRATRSRSTIGRSRPTARSPSPPTGGASRSASSASTWKRTPASRCTTASPTRPAATHLDFNRSGVPLIEIVTRARPAHRPPTRPKRSAASARSSSRIGVNDGNMEEGSLRCDANVSVRRVGTTRLRRQDRDQEPQLVPPRAARDRVRDRAPRPGAPRAARRSSRRRGSAIPATGRTTVMRTKEEARRLPLLPRARSAAAAARRRVDRGDARRALPELPDARRQRFVAQYRLPEYDAGVLTQSMPLADYFERVAAAAGNAKAASNWVMGELTRKLNETRDDDRRGRRSPPRALGGA